MVFYHLNLLLHNLSDTTILTTPQNLFAIHLLPFTLSFLLLILSGILYLIKLNLVTQFQLLSQSSKIISTILYMCISIHYLRYFILFLFHICALILLEYAIECFICERKKEKNSYKHRKNKV